MHVTEEMLKVAVAKSVEAGLLPRRALKEEFCAAQEMMRMILQSALDSTSGQEKTTTHSTAIPLVKKPPSSSKRYVPAELHSVF